jgi:hypothetical protein
LRYWKARGVKLFDWGGGGGTYKEKYGERADDDSQRSA